jgi:hypothetical protein
MVQHDDGEGKVLYQTGNLVTLTNPNADGDPSEDLVDDVFE